MNWQEDYRKLFYAANHCTYLDQAYDCGSTLYGIKAMEKYFEDWNHAAVNVERGGPGRASHFKVVNETREMIRQLVNADSADHICFTRNTNEGLNTILHGFPFEPGDNVVTAEIEHSSVIMPAVNASKTKGFEVRALPAREDERIPVDELMALTDEHTRFVLVSHVQSKNGYRIDIEELGKQCYERGIYLVVDAIQSLGLEPFDMRKWHVSAVNAAGYKGLNAVISIGFTAYDEELLKKIVPTYIAYTFATKLVHDENGWDVIVTEPGNARKFENSSLDNPGIYALHDALEIILNIGVDNIHTHVRSLHKALWNGLKELGYEPLFSDDPKESLGIAAFKPKDPQEMFAYFRSRNIALSLNGGTHIRVSLGGFNNLNDVQTFLQAAAEYKQNKY